VSAAPHQDGLLELHAAADSAGRTYLADRYQRFPLRITAPMYLDPADRGMAYCYVQNPTGGVFAGDHLVERIVVEPRARLHVTSQSATKLYRMEDGGARQDVICHVGAGALLERVPDTLIPQAGSSYIQRTKVEIAHGGVFIGAETVAPGRVAHGERFQYDRLELRTEVRYGTRPLCFETLRFEPGRAGPKRLGLLGGREYFASMLVIAPGSDGDALADDMDRALTAGGDCWAAAGALDEAAGVVVRILGGSAPAVRGMLRLAWQTARERLLGLPLLRERK
jgi:urease accessory protein